MSGISKNPMPDAAEDVENANEGQGRSSSSVIKRLHSSHDSGMDSSVLRFKNVNFTVGKGEKERHILTDVSGKVKWGRKCLLV
jgi:hypothetical protein